MTVCFKVYLRETGGMRSAAWEKTTTVDQDAARAAFEALLKRRDLDGKGVAAVLSYENQHLAFHRFDRPPGDPDYWRDRLDDIPWRRETARRGRGNVAGQGRQAKIDPEGGAATTITVRVAERQKETFLRLGGADWLRGVLDEESEKLADLQAQVDEAGIAPTINTGDVVAYEMGDMIAVIVKASVFTEAAQKAAAAGVAFK